MKKFIKKIKSFWKWLTESRRREIIAFLILTIVLFGGWRVVVARRANVPSYQTATVKKGTIVSSVSTSGEILTSNIINVSTQLTGVVKAVYAQNGDYVYAGQKIAEITPDAESADKSTKSWANLISARNALNAAKNNYRSTQASVEKAHDDVKGHDADETFTQKETRTKAEVANDNAYDAVKTAEANLSSASLSYRLLSPVITAPYSGSIDNITVTPGMIIASSSDSTVATSTNRIAVVRFEGGKLATFNASEADVNRVNPGQKATITIDSVPNKIFTGEVLTVDKIGTVSSGVTSYPIIISLSEESREVLPNMAATANITIETKKDVLIVPVEAVQTSQRGSLVRILENGKIRSKEVTVGISSETEIEIVSGLNEGEMVITGTANSSPNGTSGTSPFSTFRFGGTQGGGGNVRIQTR